MVILASSYMELKWKWKVNLLWATKDTSQHLNPSMLSSDLYNVHIHSCHEDLEWHNCLAVLNDVLDERFSH